MNVVVIGGRGFVGAAVTRRLREEHDATTVDPGVGGAGHLPADITDPVSIEDALGEMEFDAAVNLVGLTPMREPRGLSYADVHVEGAENVIEACEDNGIGRLVHMSALGADPDAKMEFLRTKGKGEEIVLGSGLDATVFRPSIIFDSGNEFVRMAERFAPTRMFPYLRTDIQPVYRGDVAELFGMAVEGDLEEEVLDVGGPDEMTIFGFVEKIYNANGYRCYPLPIQPLMVLGLYFAEPLPFVPYGADQARFLEFDNTVAKNDAEEYVELTSVDGWLASIS